MTQMKSEAQPRTPSTARVGIVDALGTGLAEAARRPALWIVPIVVDLILWLAPRLSITALTEQLMAAWRALLPMVYTQQQMTGAQASLDMVQQGMVQLAQSINLGSLLTAGWLAPPSALAPVQASRYLIISDAVLAPVGLGVEVQPMGAAPWQTASIEIGSIFAVVAVVVLLWFVSHLITAFYYRQVAAALAAQPIGASAIRGAATAPAGNPSQPWLTLAGRFAAVSLFASFAAFMLRLPLLLVTALAVFAGGGAASFLFVFGGGITLWLTMWFLSALFFVGDALAFERLPLWPSLMQSLVLVRANSFRVLILSILVNLLMLGARALWGFIGDNPAGAALAIVINGYLATAMTLGIYIFYQDLRRRWAAAQLEQQLSK